MSVGVMILLWVAFFGCVTALMTSMRGHRAHELDGSPFKDCPRCHRRWTLASYHDHELCFQCRDSQEASDGA